VTIGREIPDPELHGLSVVTSPCPVEGETGWALGVLGSTRMEYPRVVAVVDYVARTVASTLKGMAS
jgi:heat-inducible transcriptional repressor